MKRIFLILWAILALSGCATHMENVHPEWNPPKGYEEADAKCRASSIVPHCYTCGLNTKYYYGCMGSYGYERRSGPRPKGSTEKSLSE